MEIQESFEKPKQLILVYKLLGAISPLEMHKRYGEEDQKLMKSGNWDYDNPSLIINIVKGLLEEISPDLLNDEEAKWRNEILWFWYHHAISCAIFKKHDLPAARHYSKIALDLQSDPHPNKITKLLYLLSRHELSSAELHALEILEEPEKTTARELISDYKMSGGFNFKDSK